MSKSNDKKVAIAELVCRALADLRDPQGSTEKQIREYIETNYKIPDVAIKQSITTALKTGVAFGLISKKRGHYQLSKLVDNLRVMAAKGRNRTQRARLQKPKIRKIARTPTVRKTATKRPRTRSSTRGRPKSICTDAFCNQKCGKHVLSCKNPQKYGKNDSDFEDDEGDSQEQDVTDNEERDDNVKENVIQQKYNRCQDNAGVDGGYNNNDEIDEASDDEEMEADDQEEYDDDDDDEES